LLVTVLVVGLAMTRSSPENTPLPRPAQVAALPTLETGFRDTVHPFLKTYCTECHAGPRAKAHLDLSAYASVDAVARDLSTWETVLEQLDMGMMPPAKAKQQPPAELRKAVVAWIRDFRKREAARKAGDPGPVLARRLSNAEYDHTIRDLTGVDIRPAKEFPVDPTNAAGFDNSAESLALSPALFNKYLEAARRVAEHLVLQLDGFTFADYSVVAETDRDKYSVRRIIDFYKRQKTDYADYFQAAWRVRHQKASVADVAAETGLSAKYLATVLAVLTGPEEEVGPIAALQTMWHALPPLPLGERGGGEGDKALRAGCEKMRDFVVKVRQKLVPDVKNLTAPKIHNGSQPMVMWKNRTMAANRMRYTGGAAKLALEKLAPNEATAEVLTAPTDAAEKKHYEASFAKFCATFPDAFVITERARVYLPPEGEKKLGGRLLSAGFHSMTGYFRDDGPLYQLMLSEEQQRELDRLWLEFEVLSDVPMRMHTSMIWFERSDASFMRPKEFDFSRAEDKDSGSEEKMQKLKELWLAKAKRDGAGETALKAVADYFDNSNANIRRVEKARLAAEPSHLKALQTFAERAYRRPLAQSEREDLIAFYRRLRDKDGLGHEDAVRDTLVSVLVSPNFLFRVDAVAGSGDPATTKPAGAQPLSDYALASRLSYFLWSSMPDQALLDHAAAGDLHQPDILKAQAKRLIRDQRIRGLATEFAAHWLDFRRFEEHNAVDRQRFPTFTDDLRKAMFEEPLVFFLDVVREDRSVFDFLYAKHTFVNPVLANHYGMPVPKGGPDNWAKIDDARQYERGGLLPMAVFLTKNAPGLRTSPVKRGYWVVRQLLGEKIPAPPAQVPELPADESKGDLPVREMLARHRADKACAGCHQRFDSVGVAFEGYGPVGERRTRDLGGRPVDTMAAWPDGGEGAGLEGLLAYLKEKRQEEFVDNLCRKMLTFALGRTLLPSDDELVQEMRRKLVENEYRFGVLIEEIIMSPQFLNRRGDG
jgi:hypothetical protein